MGKFGGGQEFTQTEKDKLSGIGSTKTDIRTATTSVSANTWVTVVGITGLVAAGVYFLECHCRFNAGYSSGGIIQRVVTSGGTEFYNAEQPITAAACWHLKHYAIVTGATAYEYQLHTGAAGRTGTTAANASITAIRIK